MDKYDSMLFWEIYNNLHNIDDQVKNAFRNNSITKMFSYFYKNNEIGLHMSVSLAIYIYIHNSI